MRNVLGPAFGEKLPDEYAVISAMISQSFGTTSSNWTRLENGVQRSLVFD